MSFAAERYEVDLRPTRIFESEGQLRSRDSNGRTSRRIMCRCLVYAELDNCGGKDLLRSTDWLSHVQFSPADPNLLMYCHEGRGEGRSHLTIRTDGIANQLIHRRTMNMRSLATSSGCGRC